MQEKSVSLWAPKFKNIALGQLTISILLIGLIIDNKKNT